MSTIKRLRQQAFLKQGCRCFYCGYPIWEANPEQFARAHGLSPRQTLLLRCTAEHLKAKQDGGGNTIQNIVAACIVCNSRRHKGCNRTAPDHVSYKSHVCRCVAKMKWHHASISKIYRPCPAASTTTSM